MLRHLDMESMMHTEVLVPCGSLEHVLDVFECPLGLPRLVLCFSEVGSSPSGGATNPGTEVSDKLKFCCVA